MLQLLWRGEYAVFTLLIVALVLSLTVHELGHAMVAKWFGDDTAERAGRVTLNPIAHIDPMGLLMVVIVGLVLLNLYPPIQPISPALGRFMGRRGGSPDEFTVGGDLLEWFRLGMECRLAKPCSPAVLHYLGSDQSAADDF